MEQWRRWFAYFIGIPLAVGIIYTSVTALAPTWHAFRGDGERGTFVVHSANCGKGCTYKGDFESDEGSRRFTDVFLEGGSHEEDDVVTALYTGDNGTVYTPGTYMFFEVVAFLSGAFAFLAWCALSISKRRGRHRQRGRGAHRVPLRRDEPRL